MSRLATIAANIGETQSLLFKFEQALIDYPDRAQAIRFDLRSLEKQKRQLEWEYEKEADRHHEDVCRYRLFSDAGNPDLPTFAGVMLDFQRSVSLSFQAIQQRLPLSRASLTADTLAKSTFDFGFSIAGSLGAVLTIPNDRLLMADMVTVLDDAVSTVFLILRAKQSDEVRDYAHRLGPPVIRAIYKLVEHHAKNMLNADIQWGRGGRTRQSVLVQYQEFRQLQQAINETGEEKTEELQVTGYLLGADVRTKSFHLAIDGAEDIRGKFDDAITDSQTAEVPKRYSALLKKTWAINYATDEDKPRWTLLRLDSAD